jgi:hypothetical protein
VRSSEVMKQRNSICTNSQGEGILVYGGPPSGNSFMFTAQQGFARAQHLCEFVLCMPFPMVSAPPSNLHASLS